MSNDAAPVTVPDPTKMRRRFTAELSRAVLAAERRRGRQYKRADLAQRLSVSESSVYAYLKGATLPSSQVLDRLLTTIEIAGPEAGRLATLRDEVEIAQKLGRSRTSGRAGSSDESMTPQPPRDHISRSARHSDGVADSAPSGTAMVGPLIEPELVVHLFAPASDSEAYDYLRGVWQACGDQFGMSSPINTLKLPRDLPDRLQPPSARGEEWIAARQHTGPGVFEGVLRQIGDVLCLSLALAPPPESDPCWLDLHRRWVGVSEPAPESLIGVAEIYQARLNSSDPTRIDATPELAAACRLRLPSQPSAADFDGYGVVTIDGFALWEERGDDARMRRRVVIVAPHDRHDEISAWTWFRSGAAMPPFARYLMHAAMLRYELRVWADGRALHKRRSRADSAASATARLIEAHVAARQNKAHDVRTLLDQLRGEASGLSTLIRKTRQLKRAVEIASHNLAAYSRAASSDDSGVRTGANTPRGLFADDRDLADWFVQQLDDDIFYATESLECGRETIGTAVALFDGP